MATPFGIQQSMHAYGRTASLARPTRHRTPATRPQTLWVAEAATLNASNKRLRYSWYAAQLKPVA